MAKNKQDNNVTPSPPVDRWKPSRAIGLARALMKAGYGTRKQAGEMVAEGRISLDDEVVFDPNMMVDAGCQIYLDGHPLARLRPSYYAIHKPIRVVCTASEAPDRRLVSEYFPSNIPGLQTAGRLDGRTTGLMLVSNDRRWIDLVTGSKVLEQEFRVQVEGELSDLEIGVMTAGVHLPKMGLFRPLSVKVVEVLNNRTVITMVVGEGSIRQVRRMLSTLRHKVVLVRRTRIGNIRLSDLPAGGVRHLTTGEIHSIFDLEKQTASSVSRKDDG